LLGATPFNNLRAPVIWLNPSERYAWAERIVGAAVRLMSNAAAASFSASPARR
jgi:hypothetical protein